jgi:hypothetical protein
MERRPGRTAIVCAELVKAPAKAAELTADEERAVRMLHGITVDPSAPLAQAAGGVSELADELLMIEMALFRAQEKSARGRAASAATPAPTSADERAKSKIIRALRRKR